MVFRAVAEGNELSVTGGIQAAADSSEVRLLEGS